MIHLEAISDLSSANYDEFYKRATGRYYTNAAIAFAMYETIFESGHDCLQETIKIADPFAGDGRLIAWFIEKWLEQKSSRPKWEVYLFDIDNDALKVAKDRLEAIRSMGVHLSYTIKLGDSFRLACPYEQQFDFVITNPPWELLKPDRRELGMLSGETRKNYVESMKEYDSYLASCFPLSQPKKKFAGWGTNLSRVGAELSLKLCKTNGICAIVLPASFFADEQSASIRSEFLRKGTLLAVSYFPAEAKLFGKADVSSSSMIYLNTFGSRGGTTINLFDKRLHLKSSDKIDLSQDLHGNAVVPITLGAQALAVLKKMQVGLSRWGELESEGEIWAGREIDETGCKAWLTDTGAGPRFLKGKMINRYTLTDENFQLVSRLNWTPPPSSCRYRLAWRDVSRPNQKRRMVATIVPPGTVAGNSLGVSYFKSKNRNSLKALLGVMNSLCFEFQLRCYLATGHVSLSSLRKVFIPNEETLIEYSSLIQAVDGALDQQRTVEDRANIQLTIEAIVARDVYQVSIEDLAVIMDTFEKLSVTEKNMIITEYEGGLRQTTKQKPQKKIFNHLSSKLSELDMRIVHAVPPGGNWKNIPEDIPSKRIARIRESYALGEGSRSTYYGRLLASKPSYTINTYFSRPGNGCHIHYSQDRVISQREAARLQSFPDSFQFAGPQTIVNTQIGNAVPPLLAYLIATELTKSLGRAGVFIDLFAGAGGMGLGFKWAGWKPLLANDIEPRFLETYALNIDRNTTCGSITDDELFSKICGEAKRLKETYSGTPFWILGGPPCQGFSTAGKKRTMKDERNSLFLHYKKFLEEIIPDGFIFENVAGLLSMEKGKVFEQVKKEFLSVMPNLSGWVLNSEDYAIPQRRKRVFLIGAKEKRFSIGRPAPLTGTNSPDLFSSLKNWVSVDDALSDLPELEPGEDGSTKDYRFEAKTDYQRLMRGLISAQEYFSFLTSDSAGKQ